MVRVDRFRLSADFAGHAGQTSSLDLVLHHVVRAPLLDVMLGAFVRR